MSSTRKMEKVRSSRSLSTQKVKAKVKKIGDYQLGELIGKGATSQVFKAVNVETGRFVAIKEINLKIRKQQQTKLMAEIGMLKKFDHPNIVSYLGLVKNDTHICFILEYVEGGSLLSLLSDFGVFPESLCVQYIQQVLLGLSYLHSQKVIHRDVKAANILITKKGKVKLSDFGISQTMDESSEGSEGSYQFKDVADSQMNVGSPFWMAPEVIEMSSATTASDIWSVGCTIIELLEGEPPYFELGGIQAMFKIVNEGQPPLPEDISEELEDFLSKCFCKEPVARPTAEELLQHPWIVNASNLTQKKHKEEQTVEEPPPAVALSLSDLEEDEGEAGVMSYRRLSISLLNFNANKMQYGRQCEGQRGKKKKKSGTVTESRKDKGMPIPDASGGSLKNLREAIPPSRSPGSSIAMREPARDKSEPVFQGSKSLEQKKKFTMSSLSKRGDRKRRSVPLNNKGSVGKGTKMQKDGSLESSSENLNELTELQPAQHSSPSEVPRGGTAVEEAEKEPTDTQKEKGPDSSPSPSHARKRSNDKELQSTMNLTQARLNKEKLSSIQLQFGSTLKVDLLNDTLETMEAKLLPSEGTPSEEKKLSCSNGGGNLSTKSDSPPTSGDSPLAKQTTRWYIREGPMTKVCRAGTKVRWFFLFNDVLIYASGSRNKYSFHRLVKLADLEVQDLPYKEGLPSNFKYAFNIMTQDKSFTVLLDTEEEKLGWMKDFQSLTPEAYEPTAEVRFYAPLWLSDSQAKACAVCHASFTFRRKIHCRLCGHVICRDCSPGRAFLQSRKEKEMKKKKGKFKICSQCATTPSEEAQKIFCFEIKAKNKKDKKNKGEEKEEV